MYEFNLPYLSNSITWFEAIAEDNQPIFFDSCRNSDDEISENNHFDILCSNPFIELKDVGGKTFVKKDGLDFISDENFSSIVDIFQSEFSRVFKSPNKYPFEGGFVGYLSYDFKNTTDKIGNIPKAYANAYKSAIIVDHYSKVTTLISHENKQDSERIYNLLIKKLKSKRTQKDNFQIIKNKEEEESFESYKNKFDIIQKYIRNGDVYQVNLATRFLASFIGNPVYFYKKFRSINKSPYMFYGTFDNFSILSGSPEQFIGIDNEKIVSRPIKGTKPRGATRDEDNENLRILESSEKDKAENLMIVDLIRNDLGRNCISGSVGVEKLFNVESYPNVHHLVSTVFGTLKQPISPWEAFLDIFPGGSITGAPKKRSIEIIDELESFSRDVYCGSLFYMSFSGRLNSNIAIRSIIAKDNKLIYFSGGGITKDSTAEDEFKEIKHKAANIDKVILTFMDK